MPGFDPSCSLPRRVIPIIFVIDTSLAMAECISALNEIMTDTIAFFTDLNNRSADYEAYINVLCFSDSCGWMQKKLLSASDFTWKGLKAHGVRNLGVALNELERKLCRREMIQLDNGLVAPNIIFITNGEPTDDWMSALKNIRHNIWFKYSSKLAIKIGHEANFDYLAEITGTPEAVLDVKDSKLLRCFWRTLTICCDRGYDTKKLSVEKNSPSINEWGEDDLWM